MKRNNKLILLILALTFSSCNSNSADLKNDFNLYKLAINGTNNTPIKLTTDKYVSSICKYDNEIYFINYYLGGALGDSNLYSVNVLNKELKQITK